MNRTILESRKSFYRHGWESLVEKSLDDIAPDLGRFIAEWAYAGIHPRDGLDLKRRQLLAMACLTSLGDSNKEIQIHVAAALELDLSPVEIVEAIVHCLPFVGFPRVISAMKAAREVFERQGRLPVGLS